MLVEFGLGERFWRQAIQFTKVSFLILLRYRFSLDSIGCHVDLSLMVLEADSAI